jgi:hydrogenase small subunit
MKTRDITESLAQVLSNGCSRREWLKASLGTIALGSLGIGANGCAATENSTENSSATSDLDLSGRPRVKLGADQRLAIIWIEAGVCTGCATSLLGSVDPTIESVLPALRLEFQETLMDRSGPAEMDRLLERSAELNGNFLLVVDGSVPQGPMAAMTTLGVTSTGIELTAQDLITQLAMRALAVVALGTCAAFGGIPSAAPNPGNYQPLSAFVPPGKPLVRIPGCPPHPGWILETLVAVLTKGLAGLSLDGIGRPASIFGNTVHDSCPRRAAMDTGNFATAPGDPTGCLMMVGCKGPSTKADCPKRLSAGRSSCILANHPCIGCASPGFPDAHPEAGAEGASGMSPFYLDP